MTKRRVRSSATRQIVLRAWVQDSRPRTCGEGFDLFSEDELRELIDALEYHLKSSREHYVHDG